MWLYGYFYEILRVLIENWYNLDLKCGVEEKYAHIDLNQELEDVDSNIAEEHFASYTFRYRLTADSQHPFAAINSYKSTPQQYRLLEAASFICSIFNVYVTLSQYTFVTWIGSSRGRVAKRNDYLAPIPITVVFFTIERCRYERYRYQWAMEQIWCITLLLLLSSHGKKHIKNDSITTDLWTIVQSI